MKLKVDIWQTRISPIGNFKKRKFIELEEKEIIEAITEYLKNKNNENISVIKIELISK